MGQRTSILSPNFSFIFDCEKYEELQAKTIYFAE